MAATRYLVEGERLDVLLSQVRRLGRKVTVLKAEKVRSGGLGGFFTKEHYEILVEVEGVGEVPANFRPAKKHAPAKKAAPKPAEAPETPETAGAEAAAKAPETPEDPGLDALLNEARNQLTSTTEEAAAEVDAQLEQLTKSVADGTLSGDDLAASLSQNADQAAAAAAPPAAEATAVMVDGTAAAAAAGFGGGAAPRPSTPPPGATQPGGGLVDPRLQGVAAPGAAGPAAGATRRPAAPVSVEAASVFEPYQAVELGIPEDLITDEMLQSGGGTVADYVAQFPEPVEPLNQPGSVIVVVGPAPQATATVEVAGRIAGRLGSGAYSVLGGAKTILPGEGQRARSSEELQSYINAHPQGICVLALSDSLVDAHRRTMQKLLSVLYIDQVWAVVDARVEPDKLQGWLRTLPDVLKPDALAVQRVWEARHPAAVLSLGIPIGMLDGVPAKGAAWQMLLEERFQ